MPTLYLLTTESQHVTHNRKLQQDKPHFRFARPSLWFLHVTNFCLSHCVTNKVTSCSVIWPETKTICVLAVQETYEWIEVHNILTHGDDTAWNSHQTTSALPVKSLPTCPGFIFWRVSETCSFLSVTYSVTTCTLLKPVIKHIFFGVKDARLYKVLWIIKFTHCRNRDCNCNFTQGASRDMPHLSIHTLLILKRYADLILPSLQQHCYWLHSLKTWKPE
jgi:hypothetical protein